MPPLPDLTQEELARYARHLALPDVGVEGQRRLKARARPVRGRRRPGLAGRACTWPRPASAPSASSTSRSSTRATCSGRSCTAHADVGRPKVASAQGSARSASTRTCAVETHHARLTSANALDILRDLRRRRSTGRTTSRRATWSTTRACCWGSRTSSAPSSGSRARRRCSPPRTARATAACSPSRRRRTSCRRAPRRACWACCPGVIGTIQATEAIKLILGIGEPLVGRMVVYDALAMTLPRAADPQGPGLPGVRHAPVRAGTRRLRGVLRGRAPERG